MDLQNILAVFAGSGMGGVCRYIISRLVQSHLSAATVFPWGTLAVNVIGCFLIGLIYGLFDRYAPTGLLSAQWRLFLTVGFCGGFTTFSTFINENYILFQSSNFFILLAYIALSVIVGFGLLYGGYRVSLM